MDIRQRFAQALNWGDSMSERRPDQEPHPPPYTLKRASDFEDTTEETEWSKAPRWVLVGLVVLLGAIALYYYNRDESKKDAQIASLEAALSRQDADLMRRISDRQTATETTMALVLKADDRKTAELAKLTDVVQDLSKQVARINSKLERCTP